MPQVKELTNRVLKILEEERELNHDDPLIDSLLTRIANRVAECEREVRAEFSEQPKPESE